MAGAGTVAQLNDRLSSVAPTVDGSSVITALDVGTAVQGLNDTRLASLRTGEGMAAGSPAEGAGLWVQTFGNVAMQDTRSGVAGYDADTYGLALGADTTRLLDKATIGLAINYGRTEADSKNANTTDTNVDNYGFTVYGSTNVDPVFVNAQLGYAYNSIDTTRHNAGGVGVTANGDTHSSQYSAKVAVGRDYEVQPGVTLTPVVSADYAHVTTASYTETGAGVANLNVDTDNVNVLNLGVGATMSWKLKAGADGSVMKPNVHVGYAYDAVGDNVETTSTFTGGGTAFKTEGASAARSRGNIGAGMTFTTVENWDLSANYDYSVKADYQAHSGYIRALTHF
jgi:outer membrane autotransporter protein